MEATKRGEEKEKEEGAVVFEVHGITWTFMCCLHADIFEAHKETMTKVILLLKACWFERTE